MKISGFIKKYGPQYLSNWSEPGDDDRFLRTKALQDAGNLLRKDPIRGNGFLARVATGYIAKQRVQKLPKKEVLEAAKAGDVLSTGRLAWLIDSIKHPEEVELLRYVYGDMFYLFGVLTPEKTRRDRLIHKKNMAPDKADELMKRDAKEQIEHGQQLLETLHLSDFFVRNGVSTEKALDSALTRFINLIFGKNISPEIGEYAMHQAYSAGLRSACLSRQIGASIVNKSGDVIATGRNDVPKPSGGLYPLSEGEDHRCFTSLSGKFCRSDKEKKKNIEDIIQILERSLKLTRKAAEKTALKIYDNTRIKDIIEYSRSVHAEMDAIINAGENSNSSLKGAELYTTTFPCHYCARHIIVAGIKTVFYIEPYEKSLARNLHSDAIIIDPSPNTDTTKLVEFKPFQGVGPRQYLNLFKKRSDRKNKDGDAIEIDLRKALPAPFHQLDPHTTYESKVVESLEEMGLEF